MERIIDYRKDASIYKPFWEQLKANPDIPITYRGLAPRQFKTFTKAISKRKYMDNAFKAKHPYAKLIFKYTEDSVIITLELTQFNFY